MFNGRKFINGLNNLFNNKYRSHDSGADEFGSDFWLGIILPI
jgi:hypothetical protein